MQNTYPKSYHSQNGIAALSPIYNTQFNVLILCTSNKLQQINEAVYLTHRPSDISRVWVWKVDPDLRNDLTSLLPHFLTHLSPPLPSLFLCHPFCSFSLAFFSLVLVCLFPYLSLCHFSPFSHPKLSPSPLLHLSLFLLCCSITPSSSITPSFSVTASSLPFFSFTAPSFLLSLFLRHSSLPQQSILN